MSKNLYQTFKVQQTERNVPRYKSVQRTEPMVLQEELRQIRASVKALNKRKMEIVKRLKELNSGIVPQKYADKEIFLYVLELEDNCWYIGSSRNVEKRMRSHMKGSGAQWAKLHRPIKLVEVKPTGLNSDREAALLEDQLTLTYANLYGTECVRGGGYCQSKPLWPKDLRYEESAKELLAMIRED